MCYHVSTPEKKRMPLIIAPDDRDEWLEARTGNTNRADIQDRVE
jgi:hypothetical protein